MQRRSTWRVFVYCGVIVAVFLALSFFAANLLGRLQPASAPASHATAKPTHGLAVDASTLALGDLWVDDSCVHNVRVTNTGDSVVNVRSVIADCACTSVKPSRFELAPGASQILSVEIDLKRAKGRPISRTSLQLATAATLHLTNDQTVEFTLTGTVSTPFALDGSHVTLSGPLEFGKPPPVTRFKVWKHPSVGTVSCEISDGGGTVVSPSQVSDAEAVPFELRPNVVRTLGPVAFEVSVSGSTAQGRPFKPVPIRVIGSLSSDVEWQPQSLVLFQGLDPSKATERIQFWSRTGGIIENVEVLSAPEFVDVSLDENDGADSAAKDRHLAVAVRSEETQSGLRGGSILVRVTSKTERSPVPIVVPVTIHTMTETTKDPHDDGRTATELTRWCLRDVRLARVLPRMVDVGYDLWTQANRYCDTAQS